MSHQKWINNRLEQVTWRPLLSCRGQKTSDVRKFSPKVYSRTWYFGWWKKCFIYCKAFWRERSVSSFKWFSSHVISFSWWIWNTLGRRIFPLVEISRLITKMSEPLYLSISSESVCNHYCLACLPCVCGKFCSCFSDLSIIIRYLLRLSESLGHEKLFQ